LRLAVPAGWQTNSVLLETPASVTIYITPDTGDAFDVKLTSVWMDARALAETTLDSQKRNTQQAAEEIGHQGQDPGDAEPERPADLGGQHVERRLVEFVDGVEPEQHDQREERLALGEADREPGGETGPYALPPPGFSIYRPNRRRSPQGGPRVVDRTNREPSD